MEAGRKKDGSDAYMKCADEPSEYWKRLGVNRIFVSVVKKDDYYSWTEFLDGVIEVTSNYYKTPNRAKIAASRWMNKKDWK